MKNNGYLASRLYQILKWGDPFSRFYVPKSPLSARKVAELDRHRRTCNVSTDWRWRRRRRCVDQFLAFLTLLVCLILGKRTRSLRWIAALWRKQYLLSKSRDYAKGGRDKWYLLYRSPCVVDHVLHPGHCSAGAHYLPNCSLSSPKTKPPVFHFAVPSKQPCLWPFITYTARADDEDPPTLTPTLCICMYIYHRCQPSLLTS